MRKSVILSALFILVVLLTLGFAVAVNSQCPSILACELSEEVIDVQTSSGLLNLPNGTLVGGNPLDYITLTENITMETTVGTKNFTDGMKIDCDPPPNYPDPCTQT